MKTALFAMALMASGAAIAQTYPDTATTTTAPADDMDVATDMDAEKPMATTTWTDPMHSTGQMHSTGHIQAASNANPEHDARGIAVISDAAMVPAGYNGTAATGIGGPLVDPATGTAMNMTDTAHPACTADVTDNCVQTYERRRAPR